MSVEATQRETRNRKVRHTQEETTRWTSVSLAKAMASKAKANTARAKAKGSKDSKDNTDRTSTRTRTVECWNCGKRGHYSKDCWSKKDTNKGGSKGKHKPKNATDAHNLDSTKSANVEAEVEIGGFNMCYFDANAVEVRESESIKIGIDTSAGKTAWPQSVTYGKMIPGDSDLAFRTATGELVKAGKRLHVEGCDDWGSNLKIRGVQAPVCKPLLSVGECVTMSGVTVLHGDEGYMLHKSSNVAKKIDSWIRKEVWDSQYYGCTVAYQENNVYNIYMKPRGNKTDAMPLSESSGGCRPGPNP